MATLKAPIQGKEKQVEQAFRKVAEEQCPGVKLSVRFRKEYDGYNIQLEKAGVKRDLFFHETRLTDDGEETKLVEAVKYEAQSLEKGTRYKDTLELARGR
jgi:hypothetical protein